nr:fatty acyl-AMP ligase [Gammaproteobacteria bacterium]
MARGEVYPRPGTLAEVLRARAAETPERTGFIFLADGEDSEVRLSYADLDRRARAIAGMLQELGCAGQRALILSPPGLGFIESFFGCLYAGAIAVPAVAPRPNRPPTALENLVADAQPKFVLGPAALRHELESRFGDSQSLWSRHWLDSEGIDPAAADAWRQPDLAAHTLAFLQYTSGSTALPKGVKVSHGNLLANVRVISECFQHPPEENAVGWLPPYHDMGLIGMIVTPVCIGATSVLMSPMAFLQRPVRWLQAISKYRAASSGGPTFAYDLCVRRIGPEQRRSLDLGNWSLAFVGSEPVRAETLDAFAQAFEPCGFRRQAFAPCYGLAEGTLFVSGVPRGTAPLTRPFSRKSLERGGVAAPSAHNGEARWLVGCGATWGDVRVRIVNPETGRECPSHTVGEIWVCGSSVAKGYWNRPEATRETFRARLRGDFQVEFLRTGDLGFVSEGELFITGRRKGLIIIDGRNHDPHDIETTVEQSHDLVRPGGCAAFAVHVHAQERLAVVAEVERKALRAADGAAADDGRDSEA